MEEDDSLLDANADNVIIQETQPRDSPKVLLKGFNFSPRLMLNNWGRDRLPTNQ